MSKPSKEDMFNCTLLGRHISARIKRLSYQLSKIDKTHNNLEELDNEEQIDLIISYHALFFELFEISESFKRFNGQVDTIFPKFHVGGNNEN